MQRVLLASVLSLPVAMTITTSSASAAVISMNFASHDNANPDPPSTPYSMGPSESAGVVPATNWNNLLTASSTFPGLVDNTGTPTSASVTWSSGGGTWSTNITAAPGNFNMMKAHLDAISPGDASVTVSSIPASIANLYDVYVYFDSQSSNGIVTSNYTIGSQTYFMTDTAEFNGTFVQATGTTAGTRTAGANYARFSNLTGTSFTLLADSEDFRADISGIQVVGVPEPSSFFMLVFGTLFMGFIKGRRRN